jgi:hypothetical protein
VICCQLDPAGIVRAQCLQVANGESIAAIHVRDRSAAAARERTALRLAAFLQTASIPFCDSAVRAVVLSVTGMLLTINAGFGSGLDPGDVLQVERPLGAVRDPYDRAGSRVIQQLTRDIGEAAVVAAGRSVLVARFWGREAPQPRDLVRSREEF